MRAVGSFFVVAMLIALGVGALVDLANGRLGWTNYWGGFVFAPFGLLIAALLIVGALRKRPHDSERGRR